MIFNMHNGTPKKINKTLKMMLISCWSFMGAFVCFWRELSAFFKSVITRFTKLPLENVTRL